MKTQFLLIPAVFLFIATAAQAQKDSVETIMPIKDIRSLGLEPVDTSTDGHKAKEVIVLRTKHWGFTKHDTIPVYQMYFFRMHENKLTRYGVSEVITKDYDKAAYRWKGDDIIYIRFFNSKTSKKGKTWKFTLTGKHTRAHIHEYGDVN
jgi:hypothetical protein